MAASIRLHVGGPLAAGTTLRATAAQAHHLRVVMRRATGELIRIFNGLDGEWTARIETLDRAGAHLTAETRIRAQEAVPDIRLLFAPLKRDATDLVARQATELGVAMICPVLTAHGQTARVNAERLTAIAIEAAEQCERLTVPDIAAPVRLIDMLEAWPQERSLYAALERTDIGSGQSGLPAKPPTALLVGPEGGFSAEERALLHRHRAVTALSLGPRVLRAETAVVAGLAVLLGPGQDSGGVVPLPPPDRDR